VLADGIMGTSRLVLPVLRPWACQLYVQCCLFVWRNNYRQKPVNGVNETYMVVTVDRNV
jgi:hypothetical protein